MVVNDHPGCCGVAARLPKSPGIQKLTPPSSATAGFGVTVSTSVNRSAICVRSVIAIKSPRFRFGDRSRTQLERDKTHLKSSASKWRDAQLVNSFQKICTTKGGI